jgi:hypothetical protein
MKRVVLRKSSRKTLEPSQGVPGQHEDYHANEEAVLPKAEMPSSHQESP